MIIGHLSGDKEMLLSIKSRSIVLRGNLRQEVERQGIRLQAVVQSKLHGAVLHQRSGRLANSINLRVAETDTAITGSVGTNVKYAAIHEYGIDKTESVRAHLRRVKSGNIRGTIEGKRRQLAQGITMVRGHERHMVMPARSYLRSSLTSEGPAIRSALIAAVRGAFT